MKKPGHPHARARSSTHGVDLISCRSGTLGVESPAWATVWIEVLRPRSSLGPHAGFSLNRPNSWLSWRSN